MAVYDDENPKNKTNKPGHYPETHQPDEDSDQDTEALDEQPQKSLSNDELKNAEADATAPEPPAVDTDEAQTVNPDDNQIGEGYKDEGQGRLKKLAARISGIPTRKKLAGGGIVGLLITLIFFMFSSILPLKVVGLLENLQSRFTATSNNAMQTEIENMVSGFFKINAKQCKGLRIEQGCTPSYVGVGPVSTLYKVWKQNRVESLLSDKYGISLTYDRPSHKYFLRAPTLPDAGQDVTQFMDDNGNIFQEVNRAQVRSAVDEAISKEVWWKQMALRFKFGRLLEQKYGVKRCLSDIACKAKDTVSDTLAKPKRAAQIFVAERVIYPRSQIIGTVIQCLLNASCDPAKKTSEPCVPGENCEMNGAPESQTDKDTRTLLDGLVSRFVGDDAYKIYQDISDSGSLQNYLIKQVAVALGGDAAGDATEKALPVVGWVNLGAQVVQGIGSAAGKIKYLRYLTNASAMVGMYMMYRSYADQMKSGHVDPNEIGSFTDSLGPGYHNLDSVDKNGVDNNQVGGTATAEASPLYNSWLGTNPSGATQAGLNIFSPKAYAATDTTSDTAGVRCDGGGTIPASQLLCPEESLSGGNDLFNTLSNALGKVPLIGDLAKVWNDTGGKVLGLFGNALSSIIGAIPGVSKIEDLVGQAAQPLLTFISSQLIPNPFATDMSGARTFDMIGGGADVAGNDYAHNSLGGQKLTPAQAATIINRQIDSDKAQFQHQPFFARMFDKSSPYSLVNRVALALPFNKQTALASSFGTMVRNPFDKMFGIFGSVFGGHALAATAQPDPFGVNQYGYPDGTIDQNPEAYWDAHCQDGSFTQNWNDTAAANIDPDNGQATNTSVNQCLLIQASVASAGGYFSDDVLSQDDLSNSTNTPATVAGNSNIFFIGNSITDGMTNEGNLQKQLQAAGYNLTHPPEYTDGISIPASMPKIDADSGSIVAAGSIVVELGTNGARDANQAAFTKDIQNMVQKIKGVNPNIKIYWVNVHSTVFDTSVANAAIAAQAQPLGYTVIDWNQEATANPSKYHFDSSLGVHLDAQGYNNMAGFIVSSLGQP